MFTVLDWISLFIISRIRKLFHNFICTGKYQTWNKLKLKIIVKFKIGKM